MLPIIFIVLCALVGSSIMASEIDTTKKLSSSPSPQPVEKKVTINRRGSFNHRLTKEKKQNSMHELVAERKIEITT